MITIGELLKYLDELQPIDEVPVSWDKMGYHSKSFNAHVQSKDFSGWEGELPTEEESRAIASLLNVQFNDRILDLACGYGRHTLILAENYGLSITGVDVSEGLIKRAKRMAKEKNLSISYETMNGRDIHWENYFNHAIIVFNSFSLFSPKDAPIVLKRLNQALKKNGKIFIDLDNKPNNRKYAELARNWYRWPEGITLQEVCFHEGTSIEICRDLIVPKDSNTIHKFTTFSRIYSKDDITSLLDECGFQVEKIYGSWDLKKLDQESPKIILVAKKNAP